MLRTKSLTLVLLLQVFVITTGAGTGSIFYGRTDGKAGDGVKDLRGPMGVAIVGDAVYVADTDNHRIQLWKKNVRISTVAGGKGAGGAENQLWQPHDLAVTSDGTVVIADTFNHRIQWYKTGAKFGKTALGGLGRGKSLAHLNEPVQIVLMEAKKSMYVVDIGNHRVQYATFVKFPWEEFSADEKATVRTVAGGVMGSGLSQFNNPTALFVDPFTEALYIADARNYRIMRWNKGATSGVEVARNLKGKPYGIWKDNFDNLYIADSTNNVVIKQLRDGTRIVVAGTQDEVGSTVKMLRFPTQLQVDNDGQVMVIDTGNNRIMKWGPQPSQLNNLLCTFTKTCNVTLRDANFLPTNLVMLAKDGCGSLCASANLSGPAWLSSLRPEDPMLRSQNFLFGIPARGEHGEYHLCWGASVASGGLGTGDCRQVPYSVGVLNLRAVVYPQTRRCIMNAPCVVSLPGYALPDNSSLMVAEPDYKCPGAIWDGTIMPIKRVAVSAVTCNPCVSKSMTRPNVGTNQYDLTSTVTWDLGVVKDLDDYTLCLCANDRHKNFIQTCNRPYLFNYAAGNLVVCGVRGQQSFTCYEGYLCELSVVGKCLLDTDVLRVQLHNASCTDEPSIVATRGFATTTSGALNIMMTNSTIGVDTMTNFTIGPARVQGRYRLCYCATVDVDNGGNPCSSWADYTQQLGFLDVGRVRGGEKYDCPVAVGCNITVHPAPGKRLAADNRVRVLVEPSGVIPCGSATQDEIFNDLAGIAPPILPNTFQPKSATNGDYGQGAYFTFGAFPTPGYTPVCYCSNYDGFGTGKCNSGFDHFSVAGELVVRGPLESNRQCLAGGECTVSIKGINLNKNDRIRVHRWKEIGGVGDVTVCNDTTIGANGTNVFTGFMAPAINVTNNRTIGDFTNRLDILLDFPLGMFDDRSMGDYAMCYCANYDGPDSDNVPCSSTDELKTIAGKLTIRGPLINQVFACTKTFVCELTVNGFGLQNSDRLVIIKPEVECKSFTPADRASDVFRPSALASARFDKETTSKSFWYEDSLASGRFRVCYLAVPRSDIGQEVGLIIVKGVDEIGTPQQPGILFCSLGWADCNIPVKGIGLQHRRDALQIIPSVLQCGGKQVLVNGQKPLTDLTRRIGDRTITYTDRVTGPGVYERELDFHDTRPWYRRQVTNQVMYYDNFASKWIIGWETVRGKEENFKPSIEQIPEDSGKPIEDQWATSSEDGKAGTPDDVSTGPWSARGSLYIAGEFSYSYQWKEVSHIFARNCSDPSVFTTNPTIETINIRRDDLLGPPFLYEQTYTFGAPQTVGSFRACYCAGVDLDDKDDATCTADNEFLTDLGMLIVRAVVSKERYHCTPGRTCIVQVRAPGVTAFRSTLYNWPGLDHEGDINSDDVLALWLVPKGIECHLSDKFPTDTVGGFSAAHPFVASSFYLQIATFNLGTTQLTEGIFEVCFCSNFEVGLDIGDGIKCTQPHEFFEHAGTLSLEPYANLNFDVRKDPLIHANLTLPGVDAGYHIKLIKGVSCENDFSIQNKGAPVLKPQKLDPGRGPAFGGGGASWAKYSASLKPESSFPFIDLKTPGVYLMCLCPNWISEGFACDYDLEFNALVGQIVLSRLATKTVVIRTSASMVLEGDFVNQTELAQNPKPMQLLQSVLVTTFANDLKLLESQVAVKVTELKIRPRLPTDGNLTGLNIRRLQQNASDTTTSAATSMEVSQSLVMVVSFEVQVTLASGFASDDGSINADTVMSSLTGVDVQSISGKVQNAMQAQIASTEVLGFGKMLEVLPSEVGSPSWFRLVPQLEVLPSEGELVEFHCTRGLQCQVPAYGEELTDWDMILALPGDQACGVTPEWKARIQIGARTSMSALRGRPIGLSSNPGKFVSYPGPSYFGSKADGRRFRLGEAAQSGEFILCYCSSTEQGGCGTNGDFYQDAGKLVVHGALGKEELLCVTDTACLIKVAGVGLSILDRVSVVGPDAECSATGPISGVVPNPAGAAAVENYNETSMYFRFSHVSLRGLFRVCYCAYGGDTPCTAPGDFTMEAARLAVRGAAQEQNFNCTKSDIEGLSQCNLTIDGLGLEPKTDAVLLAPLDGLPCGEALFKEIKVEVATSLQTFSRRNPEFKPNPAVVGTRGELQRWPPPRDNKTQFPTKGDDSIVLELGGAGPLRASTVSVGFVETGQSGKFAVCFCALISGVGGGCSRPAQFFNKVGVLSVRGAVGNELFGCYSSLQCEINVRGYYLEGVNSAIITHPNKVCGEQGPLTGIVDHNPAQARSVSKDLGLQLASFDLGTLAPLTYSKDPPTTHRVCFCATHDTPPGDDVQCNEPKDFSHSAGLLNMIVCPLHTGEKVVPWPEDVVGSLSDPQFRLFAVVGRTCIPDGTKRPITRWPLQSEEKRNIYFTTSRKGCKEILVYDAPRMNMLDRMKVVLQVVANDEDVVSSSDPELLVLRKALKVRVKATVYDRGNNTYHCPEWLLDVEPLGCGDFAAHFIGFTTLALLLWNLCLSGCRGIKYPSVNFSSKKKRKKKSRLARCIDRTFGCCCRACKKCKKKNPLEGIDLGELQTGGNLPGRGSVAGRASVAHGSLPGEEPPLPSGEPPELSLTGTSTSKVVDSPKHVRSMTEDRCEAKLAHPAVAVVAALGWFCIMLGQAVFAYVIQADTNDTTLLLMVCAGCVALSFLLQASLVVVLTKPYEGNTLTKIRRRSIPQAVACQAKLQFDLIFPALARAHYFEPWCVAFFAVSMSIVLLQVLYPVFLVLRNFRNCREVHWEEVRRRRLLAVLTFFECSQWRFVRDAVWVVAQDCIGHSVQPIAKWWTSIRFVFQVLDVTPFQIFFLLFYRSRLEIPEVACIACSVAIALVLCSGPGLLRACTELFNRMFMTFLEKVGAVVLLLVYKNLLFYPLSMFCPSYEWPVGYGSVLWSSWATGVFVVLCLFTVFWWVKYAKGPQNLAQSDLKWQEVTKVKFKWQMRNEEKRMGEAVTKINSGAMVCNGKPPVPSWWSESRPMLSLAQDLLDQVIKQLTALSVQTASDGRSISGLPPGLAKQLGMKKSDSEQEEEQEARAIAKSLESMIRANGIKQKISLLEFMMSRLGTVFTQKYRPETYHGILVENLQKISRRQHYLYTNFLPTLEILCDRSFQNGSLQYRSAAVAEVLPYMHDKNRLAPERRSLEAFGEQVGSGQVERRGSGSKELESLSRSGNSPSGSKQGTSPERRGSNSPGGSSQQLETKRSSRDFQSPPADTPMASYYITALTAQREKPSALARVKARLFGKSTKNLPGVDSPLIFVHWRTLEGLGRLPDYNEVDFLVNSTDALKATPFSKPVGMAVIHRWSSAEKPDNDRNVTARRLLEFARWYRDRWGACFEPHFWIDYCCLPRGEAAEVAQIADLVYPVAFASCDVVVLLKSRDVDSRAWMHAELSLAYAYSRGGLTPYCLGKSVKASSRPGGRGSVRTSAIDIPGSSRAAGSVYSTYSADRSSILESDECADNYVVQTQTMRLRDPLNWDVMQISNPADRSRIVFLLECCAAAPVHWLSGRFARPLLDFDSTTVQVWDISRPRNERKRGGVLSKRVNVDKDEEPWISVRMTLNIDYQMLGADDKNELKGKMRDTLAKSAGVPQDAVYVTFTPGSVKVEAEIRTPDGRLAESIEKSMKKNDISKEVLEAANSIPGVKAAVTGKELKVKDLEVKAKEDESDGSSTSNEGVTRRKPFIASFKVIKGLQGWTKAIRKTSRVTKGGLVRSKTYEVGTNRQAAFHVRTDPKKEKLSTGNQKKTNVDDYLNSQYYNHYNLADMNIKAPELPSNKAYDPSDLLTAEFLSGKRSSLRQAGRAAELWKAKRAPRIQHPDQGFHGRFHPGTILICDERQVAVQRLEAEALYEDDSVKSGGGGMACTSHPVAFTPILIPNVLQGRGVMFEVTVEARNGSFSDGMGIGFSATNPENWDGLFIPRLAKELPSSWMGGHNAIWTFKRQTKWITGLKAGGVPWLPGRSVRCGDVVAAIITPPPDAFFKILVNNKVVAESTGETLELPDPEKTPLWGVVDVDGTCVCVRLGNHKKSSSPRSPPADEPPQLGEVSVTDLPGAMTFS